MAAASKRSISVDFGHLHVERQADQPLGWTAGAFSEKRFLERVRPLGLVPEQWSPAVTGLTMRVMVDSLEVFACAYGRGVRGRYYRVGIESAEAL